MGSLRDGICIACVGLRSPTRRRVDRALRGLVMSRAFRRAVVVASRGRRRARRLGPVAVHLRLVLTQDLGGVAVNWATVRDDGARRARRRRAECRRSRGRGRLVVRRRREHVVHVVVEPVVQSQLRRRPPRRRGRARARRRRAASTPAACASAMIGVGGGGGGLAFGFRAAGFFFVAAAADSRAALRFRSASHSATAASRSPLISLICVRSFFILLIDCAITSWYSARSRLSTSSPLCCCCLRLAFSARSR